MAQTSYTHLGSTDTLFYSCPLILFFDTGGYWKTYEQQDINSWITIGYPDAININYLRIRSYENYRDIVLVKFDFRVSNHSGFLEGKYDVLASFDNVNFSNIKMKEFRFENDKSYQYYQLLIYKTKSNEFQVIKIAELMIGLEVRGDIFQTYNI